MNFRVALTSVWLFLCVLLGGSSSGGWLANALLQVVAIALILLHMWSPGPPASRAARVLLSLATAFALLVVATLVPLPAEVWSGLPGREPVADALRLLGLTLPSLPASLDARRTILSSLSLVVPVATFLLATRLTRDERVSVLKLLLWLTVAVVGLGAAQLFGGSETPLRFYEITTLDRAVGTFANPNHMATLLLMALPFSAALIGISFSDRRSKADRGVLYGVVALFITVGIAVNGSLAGYGLLLPVAALSFLLFRRASGRVRPRDLLIVVGLGAAVLAASTVGPLSGQRLDEELRETPFGRKTSIPTTIAAAQDFFPVGSGLGTFRDVYRTYEAPETVSFIFVNHAHSDYVEIVLELGLLGMVLVAAVLAWILFMSVKAWRGEYRGANLSRAASVALGVVILHSIVDYPLRTATIAALAALCCGYLLQPPSGPRRRNSRETTEPESRHLSAD